MQRKQTDLSFDEWIELGIKVKQIGEYIHKLDISYRKENKYTKKIKRLFSLLKNELDEQVLFEYTGEKATRIFYGSIEIK
jgi:hypothetical protein